MKLGSEETYNLIEKFLLFIKSLIEEKNKFIFSWFCSSPILSYTYYYYPTVEYIIRDNHLNYDKTIKLSLAHVACLGYDTSCTRQAIVEETNNELTLTIFYSRSSGQTNRLRSRDMLIKN
jgi:hypothetical protein